MWRLDRNHDEEDFLGSEPDAAAEHLTPDPMRQDNTSPESLSLGDPELVAGNVAEPAWRRWQGELAEVGGRSPLVRFVDTPRTRIELSTTHPGGLPQFITGKSTLLSSLIRDELALRNARLAAAEITQKGVERDLELLSQLAGERRVEERLPLELQLEVAAVPADREGTQ